jgi:hypothetical protein
MKIHLALLAAAIPALGKTIYVSPSGAGAKDGKAASSAYAGPAAGISAAAAGDTVLLLGGTYALNATVKITSSGTANQPICLFAENAYTKRALFDFRTQGYGSSNQGIILQGNWWHLKGIDVWGAGDNGMQITGGSSNNTGSNNTVEWCSFYENMDAGLQIVHGGANNLVLNCDSYWNYDSLTDGGNADGFAPKLTLGTGNTFRGCRSYGNSDDAWDGYLKEAESSLPDDITTTIENCWAFNNGYYHGDPNSSKNTSSMNGNGFKMGGSTNHDQRHNQVLRRCLSFGNKSKQFDQNNNPGSMTLINCTAYGSGQNFAIASDILASGKVLTVENSVSAGGGTVKLLSSDVEATNSWSSGFSVANSDFQSVDTAGVRGPRQSDGSLPDVKFMHLASASKLIDAGTKISGITYSGSAPDLGAFETGTTTALRSVAPTGSFLVRAAGSRLLVRSGFPAEARIVLLSADGRAVRDFGTLSIAPSGTTLDLGTLPKGISICSVQFADGTSRNVALSGL